MADKKKEEKKFYKIPVNIYDGAALINLFPAMGGSDQEKILRKEVRDLFTKTFPESEKPDNEKPPKTEKRVLELSKRHVRAVAHSMIVLYGKEETVGQIADHIQKVAEAWFMWSYMRELIGPESYPEFDGELSNEPDLISAEADEKVKETEEKEVTEK